MSTRVWEESWVGPRVSSGKSHLARQDHGQLLYHRIHLMNPVWNMRVGARGIYTMLPLILSKPGTNTSTAMKPNCFAVFHGIVVIELTSFHSISTHSSVHFPSRLSYVGHHHVRVMISKTSKVAGLITVQYISLYRFPHQESIWPFLHKVVDGEFLAIHHCNKAYPVYYYYFYWSIPMTFQQRSR